MSEVLWSILVMVPVSLGAFCNILEDSGLELLYPNGRWLTYYGMVWKSLEISKIVEMNLTKIVYYTVYKYIQSYYFTM